jgi:hypothetical protein
MGRLKAIRWMELSAPCKGCSSDTVAWVVTSSTRYPFIGCVAIVDECERCGVTRNWKPEARS